MKGVGVLLVIPLVLSILSFAWAGLSGASGDWGAVFSWVYIGASVLPVVVVLIWLINRLHGTTPTALKRPKRTRARLTDLLNSS